MSSSTLARLSTHSSETCAPLFYIHSSGFLIHFSVQLPHTFPIVDTHPDPASTSDLRLLKPWPELVEYAEKRTRNLESLANHEHGHIPYLLLMLHYLEEWKKSHDGSLPSTYKEKNEFKKVLDDGMRKNNAEGGEENYEQAISAVLKTLNSPAPSSGARGVFEAPEAQNATASVSGSLLLHGLFLT